MQFSFKTLKHLDCVVMRNTKILTHLSLQLSVLMKVRIYCLMHGILRRLTVDLSIAVLFPIALSSAITVLRCVCSEFFRLYLSMIPPRGPFYRKPLASSFTCEAQCVGIDKLSVYTKTMYAEAGIDSSDRRIVNHSGRVSCCTRLNNAGFDEQSVTDRSGHRSNAVQICKRPCVQQQKAVSNALDAPNIGSTTVDACVKTEVHHAIDNRNVKLHAGTDASVNAPSENKDCLRIVLPLSISTEIVVKEIKVCL